MSDDECYGTYSVHNGNLSFEIEDTYITGQAGIEGAYEELVKFVTRDMADELAYSRGEAMSALLQVGEIHGVLFDWSTRSWQEDRLKTDPMSSHHRYGIEVTDESGEEWAYWIQRDS